MKNFARLYNIVGFAALFVLSSQLVPPIWLTQNQADAFYGIASRIGVDYENAYLACIILMHLLIAAVAFVIIKLLVRFVRRKNVAQ